MTDERKRIAWIVLAILLLLAAASGMALLSGCAPVPHIGQTYASLEREIGAKPCFMETLDDGGRVYRWNCGIEAVFHQQLESEHVVREDDGTTRFVVRLTKWRLTDWRQSAPYQTPEPTYRGGEDQ